MTAFVTAWSTVPSAQERKKGYIPLVRVHNKLSEKIVDVNLSKIEKNECAR